PELESALRLVLAYRSAQRARLLMGTEDRVTAVAELIHAARKLAEVGYPNEATLYLHSLDIILPTTSAAQLVNIEQSTARELAELAELASTHLNKAAHQYLDRCLQRLLAIW